MTHIPHIQCCTMQHSDVNMIQRGIELSFFISSGKTEVLKQRIHNRGWAGWKPKRYARLYSAHFEESCFEVDTFSKTNVSRSFKTLEMENVKA